jgi:hypothetical protein
VGVAVACRALVAAEGDLAPVRLLLVPRLPVAPRDSFCTIGRAVHCLGSRELATSLEPHAPARAQVLMDCDPAAVAKVCGRAVTIVLIGPAKAVVVSNGPAAIVGPGDRVTVGYCLAGQVRAEIDRAFRADRARTVIVLVDPVKMAIGQAGPVRMAIVRVGRGTMAIDRIGPARAVPASNGGQVTGRIVHGDPATTIAQGKVVAANNGDQEIGPIIGLIEFRIAIAGTTGEPITAPMSGTTGTTIGTTTAGTITTGGATTGGTTITGTIRIRTTSTIGVGLRGRL